MHITHFRSSIGAHTAIIMLVAVPFSTIEIEWEMEDFKAKTSKLVQKARHTVYRSILFAYIMLQHVIHTAKALRLHPMNLMPFLLYFSFSTGSHTSSARHFLEQWYRKTKWRKTYRTLCFCAKENVIKIDFSLFNEMIEFSN